MSLIKIKSGSKGQFSTKKRLFLKFFFIKISYPKLISYSISGFAKKINLCIS